jgi:enoyl-CoA hydratase
VTDYRRATNFESVERGDEIGREALDVVAMQWVIGEPVAALVHAQDAKAAVCEHTHLAIPQLVVEAEAGNKRHGGPIAEILHVNPHAIIDVDKCHFGYHLRSLNNTGKGLMSTSLEALSISSRGEGVSEISLVRPKLLNRFDNQLQIELATALEELAKDDGVRAIVLGSTGRAFSAGGDFALMRAAHDDADSRRETIEAGARLLRSFLDLPQPIVAAVQGPAIGLGATVALMCDVVVAARTAKLADTHVKVGLVAGDGGCLVWPQAAGMLRARRHLLTGDPLDATTAYQLGMVTDIVDEPDEVLPCAREIAKRIAALAPLAVQGTKRALNHVTSLRADEVVQLAFELEEHTLTSDDLLEGIAAFNEGRVANFVGR